MGKMSSYAKKKTTMYSNMLTINTFKNNIE